MMPATLVRRGEIPGHQIEERISVAEDNRLRVVVRDRLTQSGVQLSRLMNHYYFMPDNRAMGYALPLDLPGSRVCMKTKSTWPETGSSGRPAPSPWPMACTRPSFRSWIE